MRLPLEPATCPAALVLWCQDQVRQLRGSTPPEATSFLGPKPYQGHSANPGKEQGLQRISTRGLSQFQLEVSLGLDFRKMERLPKSSLWGALELPLWRGYYNPWRSGATNVLSVRCGTLLHSPTPSIFPVFWLRPQGTEGKDKSPQNTSSASIVHGITSHPLSPFSRLRRPEGSFLERLKPAFKLS